TSSDSANEICGLRDAAKLPSVAVLVPEAADSSISPPRVLRHTVVTTAIVAPVSLPRVIVGMESNSSSDSATRLKICIRIGPLLLPAVPVPTTELRTVLHPLGALGCVPDPDRFETRK